MELREFRFPNEFPSVPLVPFSSASSFFGGVILNNQREIFGWSMYDWANSAFSTIVVTTFLGPYLTALAEANGGTVNLFGYPLEGAGFYPLCVSISVHCRSSSCPFWALLPTTPI